MLAVLGHIVTTAGVRLPGNIDYAGTTFASIPAGLAALEKVPLLGLAQIVAFVGALELFVMKDVKGTGEFVGDFRNGGRARGAPAARLRAARPFVRPPLACARPGP